MLAAATIVAIGGWLVADRDAADTLRADFGSVLNDTDADFLPDVVEWAVITSAVNPDTDGDECPDFVEVVQRGSPRQPGVVRPLDHEMRVVVTAPPPGHASEPTGLHLLFRFVGEPSLLTSFQTWLELPLLPGLRVPLDVIGAGGSSLVQRATANQGLWMRLSVPLVSEQILRALLPCSIHAQATIGGRSIYTAVHLFDIQGATTSLTPFGNGRFALQSIGALASSSAMTNRVCLLQLELVGVGPAGSVFEVTDADCEDCNELQCGPSCPQCIGWLIDIPGGIESLNGG